MLASPEAFRDSDRERPETSLGGGEVPVQRFVSFSVRRGALARTLLIVAAALFVGLAPISAHAQGQTRHAASHFALGTCSALLNFVYGPVKVIYAVVGSATGGLAWIITGGDGQVARKIIQPAVRGDYAIVPDNLTFDRPLHFVGRDPYRTYDPASP